jgi:transcriptional regulator with XRE-family HTH domain
MDKTAMFANNLAEVREAGNAGSADELARRVGLDPAWYARIEAGEILPTAAELERLAAALGVERERLYQFGLLGTIGGAVKKPINGKKFYEGMADLVRLLVDPDEVAWLERASEPDGTYDVFVNMSCGTQARPDLPLNTAAVLHKLGVNFAAGAGQNFCCGGYLRISGHPNPADTMAARSERQATARQASTMVHWCTACVNVFGHAAVQRSLAGGGEPVRHMQILDFLAERLEQLGGDAPWVRRLDRRVVVHGHQDYSPVHAKATLDVARVLRQVPGVEVVGFIEQTFVDSFCDVQPGVPPRTFPTTPAEMRDLRRELAAIVRSTGADTVSCQHQGCHSTWAPFASADLSVRHAVSLLAEALGCEHPDRRQAAALLGDPDAVVAQTRPIWTSWGISEDRAREIAHREFGPVAAAKVDACSCGRNSCGGGTGEINVLRGVDWRTAVHAATGGESAS